MKFNDLPVSLVVAACITAAALMAMTASAQKPDSRGPEFPIDLAGLKTTADARLAELDTDANGLVSSAEFEATDMRPDRGARQGWGRDRGRRDGWRGDRGRRGGWRPTAAQAATLRKCFPKPTRTAMRSSPKRSSKPSRKRSAGLPNAGCSTVWMQTTMHH